MSPTDRESPVHKWCRRLGLAATELLPKARGEQHRHFALMDGVEGSFAVSTETIERGAALDWTWSSQLALHVTVDQNAVLAIQVAPNAPVLKFDRDQVEENIERFFEELTNRRVEPRASIVDHIVGCFRSHRHVAAQFDLNSEQSLNSFLTMIDDNIHSKITSVDERLPAEHRDRVNDELKYNRLVRRNTDLGLTMRHAAGMVFQETFAELSTEPMLPQLFGLAPAPSRSTRNRMGAYYTPPGLARVLTDLVVSPYLDNQVIRIVDPACGSGIFLSEIVRSLDRKKFQGYVELIGLDLSPIAIRMAEFALNYIDCSFDIKIRTRVADFLDLSETLNADIIVMNPPFVAAPDLDPQLRDRAREVLGDSYVNRPDLSMVFATLALSHLRQGGTLATLVPSGVLGQAGGKRWRSSIVEASTIDLIAVLGDHGLFRDAIVNVAAIVLRNSTSSGSVPPLMLWASQRRGASSAALRRLRRWHEGDRLPERTIEWSIQQGRGISPLERDDWTPRPYMLGDLPDRLRNTPSIGTVSDFFHVELGIRAGKLKDRLQLTASDYLQLPEEERLLFRPVAETRSIRRGGVHPTSWAFYPDTPMSCQEIQEYAPTFFDRFLESLSLDRSEIIDFARPRRKTNVRRSARIVARAFISVDSFAVDADGSVVVIQGYSWLPRGPIMDSSYELVELLTHYSFILNSQVFFLLARENARIVAGGQVDGAKSQVSRIPLPDLPALYMEVPSLRNMARNMWKSKSDVYPASEELDGFAATAYQTNVQDWFFA